MDKKTEQLEYACAIHGPYKRLKPLTLPLWVRLLRRWDAWLQQRRTK